MIHICTPHIFQNIFQKYIILYVTLQQHLYFTEANSHSLVFSYHILLGKNVVYQDSVRRIWCIYFSVLMKPTQPTLSPSVNGAFKNITYSEVGASCVKACGHLMSAKGISSSYSSNQYHQRVFLICSQHWTLKFVYLNNMLNWYRADNVVLFVLITIE